MYKERPISSKRSKLRIILPWFVCMNLQSGMQVQDVD